MKLLLPNTRYEPDMVKVASMRVLPSRTEREELDIALAQRSTLLETKKRVLPIEDASAPEIDRMLLKVNADIHQVERHRKIYEVSRGEYQLLDLSFLRWRDAQGFPIYAVFKPDVPHFGFRSVVGAPSAQYVTATAEMLPAMPQMIANYYGDVMRNMVERGKLIYHQHLKANRLVETVTSKLITKFGGLIPDEVKEDMVRARASRLFIHILIIAEVVKWSFDTVVLSRKGDPLVVGLTTHDAWLIKAFDTTSAEQLIADEFAVHPF